MSRTLGTWHYGAMSQTVFSHGVDGTQYTAICELSFRDELECKDDGEFIVKACNNYDRLVEQVRMLADMIDGAIDSHIYDVDNGDEIDEDSGYVGAVEEAQKLLTELGVKVDFNYGKGIPK